MDMIYWAMIGLAAFVAIWILFVIPAERRHHERKLEMIRRRIEKRQAAANQVTGETAGDRSNDNKES